MNKLSALLLLCGVANFAYGMQASDISDDASMGNETGIKEDVWCVQDNDGNTVLHICCMKKDFNAFRDIMTTPVDSGKFIEIKNNKGELPLDATDENGDTLIHTALKRKNIDVAKILSACGANLLIKNNKDESPADLIKQFSNESKDEDGNTAFHRACLEEDMMKICFFIRADVGFDCENKAQKTPRSILDSKGGLCFFMKKWTTPQDIINAMENIDLTQ